MNYIAKQRVRVSSTAAPQSITLSMEKPHLIPLTLSARDGVGALFPLMLPIRLEIASYQGRRL